MKQASIVRLKEHLSRYLQAVKAGEEIAVTERGRVVARVVPASSTGPSPAETDRLVRAGVIRPGKGAIPKRFWQSARKADDPDGAVLAALLGERDSER